MSRCNRHSNRNCRWQQLSCVAASIIAIGEATGVTACAAGPPASSSAPVASTVRRDIRSLTILPGSARACPGDVISARYVAGLGDGSRVSLSREEVASLTLTGLAAQPRGDGTWKTSANPMASIADGFRLSASLVSRNGSDSLVHGDTVVVPTYDCLRSAPIELRPISRSEDNVKAYVRLGVLPTPFYDSMVVAVVEVDGREPIVRVLGPKEMRPGAIRVDAPGKPGKPGTAGQPGADGDACSNGGNGEDGEPGQPGSPAGEVDIIIQGEAAWLADLVAVTNVGGKGGAAGPGGRGGRAGAVIAKSGAGPCRPLAGKPGRNGPPGADGLTGRPPRTTRVPLSLLWSNSPIWADSTARSALDALMKYKK